MVKYIRVFIIFTILLIFFLNCQNNNNDNNSNTKNNNINPVDKNEELDNVTSDEDNNQDDDIDYYNELKSWIDVFYDNMIAFYDKKSEEQDFAVAGTNFLSIQNEYTDLLIELENLKDDYYENIEKPSDNIPEEISDGLQKANQYYKEAMDYQITAIENIILMIENLNNKEDREVGNYTDENLLNYQNNSQQYDFYAAKMMNQIQTTLKKIDYQLQFKDGSLVKYSEED